VKLRVAEARQHPSGNTRGNRRIVRCVQRVASDGREALYRAIREQRPQRRKVEGLRALMLALTLASTLAPARGATSGYKPTFAAVRGAHW